MSSEQRLRKMLSSVGWTIHMQDDLCAALVLIAPLSDMAHALAAAINVYACQFHNRQAAAEYAKYLRTPQSILAALEGLDGPQDDPGDETLPLFEQ